ncbi:MAG: CDP-diacylglycerol--glycerol-3-phosphate 3-phosphatidyltransferase [Christensenellales bacterium]
MNLPNKITLARIIMLPVFLAVGLINFPYSNFVAIALFILLAFTDYLDGHIARKYNLVTNLGKFLDPIADKLLCTTGLLLLIVGANPIIPHPYGIIAVFIILLRDYAVTGLRQIAQLKGVIIPADKLGKIKANFQYVMIVYGFLVAGLNAISGVNGTAFMTYFEYVFYGFVAVTTLIVLISGILYLVKNTAVFKEDDNSKAETKNDTTSNSVDNSNLDNVSKPKKATKTANTKTEKSTAKTK